MKMSIPFIQHTFIDQGSEAKGEAAGQLAEDLTVEALTMVTVSPTQLQYN